MFLIPLRLLDGASAAGAVIVLAAAPSADTSIANCYVQDMRIKRRRPITAEEFALLRQFIEVRERSRLQHHRFERELRAINRQFARSALLRPIETYSARLPYRGDYSGLVPVRRRAAGPPARNREDRTVNLAGNGRSSQRIQRSPVGRLRQPVRVHAAREARV